MIAAAMRKHDKADDEKELRITSTACVVVLLLPRRCCQVGGASGAVVVVVTVANPYEVTESGCCRHQQLDSNHCKPEDI